MSVSVIYQHESATGTHMSLLVGPPASSHPSRLSQSWYHVDWVDLPVSCSKSPLAICFAYDSTYVSILFSLSISPTVSGDRSRDRSLFSPLFTFNLILLSLLRSFQMPVLYSLESSDLPALHDLCRVLMSWSRTKLKLIPWVILNAFRVTIILIIHLPSPWGFHQHLFTSLT